MLWNLVLYMFYFLLSTGCLLGCLWAFLLAILNSGCSLYQNSNQRIVYCPINLANWLIRWVVPRGMQQEAEGEAGAQEWSQQPLCTVLVRLSSPCEEDSHGQIFKLSAVLSWESCKGYWVRTFNKKLSFTESYWIAVSGDEWMYGGRALPIQMFLFFVCPIL